MSDLEKQQKVANMLAAGNLWYQKKSSVALNNMVKVQKETKAQIEISNNHLANISNNITQLRNDLKQMSDDIVRETKLQGLMQEKRYQEEDVRRMKKEFNANEKMYRKDAFFHLNKELQDLDNSNLSNLEKYFSIASIKILMKQHNVSTKLTDDFEEKKIISESLDSITRIENKLLQNFTESDNKDLNHIIDISKIDEEKEINELNSKRKKILDLDNDINDLKKSENLYEIVKKYEKILLDS